jgi:calcineurin-like phosphoesterase family protein
MRWFTSDLHLGHANIIRYCDRPFAAIEEMDAFLVAAWNAEYLDAGFEQVTPGPVALEVGGRAVRAHHFPYRGDSQPDDRYVGHRPGDDGGRLLHGHVHERWRRSGRQINVGVDAWAGRPVSETALGALMASGVAELAPSPWTSGAGHGATVARPGGGP